MGWKNIKEKFGIHHNVQVREKGICIGSDFVSDLASIDKVTGKVEENQTFAGFLRDNYPALQKAAPEELVWLIAAPDTFTASIPVFTYDGAEILEKMCEEPGYPNVTHDGCMMYENTFSTDKSKVVAWAKRNVACAVEQTQRRIAEVEKDLAGLRDSLAGYQADEAKLAATYPSVQSPGE